MQTNQFDTLPRCYRCQDVNENHIFLEFICQQTKLLIFFFGWTSGSCERRKLLMCATLLGIRDISAIVGFKFYLSKVERHKEMLQNKSFLKKKKWCILQIGQNSLPKVLLKPFFKPASNILFIRFERGSWYWRNF